MIRRVFIISTKYEKFSHLILQYLNNIETVIIRKKTDLLNYRDFCEEDIILSYNTNIIISESILNKVYCAVNIHPATSEFPGRDPNHWAIYRNATQFGATAHFMTSKVDEGDIVDIEKFVIPSKANPMILSDMAEKSALKIIARLWPRLIKGEKPKPLEIKWKVENKTTRKMFFQICEIDPEIKQNELEKRIQAFHVEGFNNLFTIVNNFYFYYLGEKK